MTDRPITEAEAAVIEAVQEWRLQLLASEFIPVSKARIKEAQDQVLSAMSDLENESDGRWVSP